MFFSVVIPLYNKEPYILRSIQSVLSQTHTDFELIVIDDGSTDGGLTLTRSISDPRVRLIQQPNGGVSRARNRGVQEASAEWVAFLDADDEYFPRFLEEMARFLHTYSKENLSFVGANYYIGSFSRTANSSDLKSGVYEYFDLFHNQCSPNNSSTTIVNKNCFIQVGGFPECIKQFEDWTTWMKLALVGQFGYISTPLGFYHSIEGSVTQSLVSSDTFFEGASFLLQTISEQVEAYLASRNRKKIVFQCLNEISINIAVLLAYDGDKKQAIKILSFVRLIYFSFKRRGRIGRLVLHLIFPHWIALLYRKYK